MTNIHDIAKQAGVSVSTVSRVLNNYKYVASDKRAAVLDIIEALNYTPNKHAIDLIRGETRNIGVILPYNNNTAFDQLLHGILNKASKQDYLITVLPSQYDKAKEIGYLEKIKSKLFDGIILTSRANDWEKIVPYSQYGPIISCEFTEQPEIGCAYTDRYRSFLDALQLLKNKGHQAVAFTTARLASNSTTQIIAAYQEIFGDIPAGYHITNCQSLDDGYAAAQQFMQLPERPSAIYANGDEVAGGIYLYAQSQQLQIPSDVAIIGQENQPVGIGLGLSTVDHQLTKIGEQALNLVIHRSKEKVNIPYQMVERQSM
ncbi:MULTISPECIES: LacI family DNA-binding transcriptional regulator [Gracilibacillus]|uniref:LacI family DNA-binding transcriptional regulator n=1 Tax=Gracilibacillus TaxID=74385 RepID=UPI00082454C5|nr:MULTISPECIES: LacI family DNA-binding transcriptional regulator [Gracilibacillus]